MRIHKTFVIDGELQPGVFRDHDGAMSVHWQKYCPSPSLARARARHPEDNGIISLVAGRVRKVPLGVDHDPDATLGDRSHTNVRGEKTAEARVRLLGIFEWCLRIGQREIDMG
ncbi:MAG TPA: hypothetical protein VEZ11_05535 [Thermoanaerobaculia bacterium]|nr:hypothetical protein [Thermoanaerobaculia bacterium]